MGAPSIRMGVSGRGPVFGVEYRSEPPALICWSRGTLQDPAPPRPWSRRGTTSLGDTALLCELDHHHVHNGRTIQLRDGRWLNADGWTDGPGRWEHSD